MKQKTYSLIIIFICLSILSGCWGKKELNELSIATALSVDKAEDGYQVSVQLVNPGEVSPQAEGSGITPVIVQTEKGQTIYEASRKLSLNSPRRIYVSHLRLLVISEELAKEGIADILDFLSRDTDFRSDFFIIIAKDSRADELLKLQTITERIPANALYSLLKTSGEIWAEMVAVNLNELSHALTIPGRNPVLSGMGVEGDIKIGETKANTESSDPTAKFKYLGLALFDRDKLVGWLSNKEGKGYNYISDQIHNTIENIDCPGGDKMSMVIKDSKTKKRVKIDKAGKPKIQLHIRSEVMIGEVNCSINLENISEIRTLEKVLEKRITSIVEKTIDKVQKDYQADVFGFGETIYRSYPKVWKILKSNWKEHFENLEVNVHVKANIRKLGTTGDSLIKDIKE